MYTYKAIQTCELLVLAKKHFTQLLFHEFKEIGDEFKQAAHSRKRRTYKTVKDAISYYEALARTNESQTFSKIREKKKTLIKLTGIVFLS